MKIEVLLPASEIPDGSTVRKIGHCTFPYKIYNQVNVHGQTIKGDDVFYLVSVNNPSNSIYAINAGTIVIWITDCDKLQQFLYSKTGDN